MFSRIDIFFQNHEIISFTSGFHTLFEPIGGIMPATKARLFFADAAVENLEAEKTLPAKFNRMLRKLNLPSRVEGKTVRAG